MLSICMRTRFQSLTRFIHLLMAVSIAQFQVEIMSLLVMKFSIPRDQIVILTQYRAQQKTIITELLKKKGFSNKNVSTVVLSQGQFRQCD